MTSSNTDASSFLSSLFLCLCLFLETAVHHLASEAGGQRGDRVVQEATGTSQQQTCPAPLPW